MRESATDAERYEAALVAVDVMRALASIAHDLGLLRRALVQQ